MPNIKKDEKTGKYYFQISLGFDEKTGKRIRLKRKGFKTKAQAREARDALIKQHNDLKNGAVTNVTLGEFYKDYLLIAKNNLKESSFNARDIAMRNSILVEFGECKLSDIKPLDVHRWMEKQLKVYAPATINQHLSFFKDLMNKAVDLELIPVNRLSRVKALKIDKVEMEIWTKEEFYLFLSTFNRDDPKEEMFYVLFKLLFFTGARINEVLALNKNDVYDNRIKIEKSIYMKTVKEWQITSPKSKFSIREIFLDQEMSEDLNNWVDKAPYSDFLFSINGGPMSRQVVRYFLIKHAKLAGVKAIRVHDLRHSHASLLISLGVNILAIAKRLGHKDATQILETYGHLYPDFQAEIVDKLESVKVEP